MPVNRLRDSDTSPIPSPLTRSPRRPPMERPWNAMSPFQGRTSPAMHLRVVDLPAPFGPSRATSSPWLTCRLMPWTTRRNPYPASSSVTRSIPFVSLAQVGLNDRRITGHLPRRPVGDLLTLAQHSQPVAEAHDGRHHVLDHDDGDAAVSHPPDDVHQR